MAKFFVAILLSFFALSAISPDYAFATKTKPAAKKSDNGAANKAKADKAKADKSSSTAAKPSRFSGLSAAAKGAAGQAAGSDLGQMAKGAAQEKINAAKEAAQAKALEKADAIKAAALKKATDSSLGKKVLAAKAKAEDLNKKANSAIGVEDAAPDDAEAAPAEEDDAGAAPAEEDE